MDDPARGAAQRRRPDRQHLNDQPVTGEFVPRVNMHTITTKPEDFRLDKFERIQLRR